MVSDAAHLANPACPTKTFRRAISRLREAAQVRIWSGMQAGYCLRSVGLQAAQPNQIVSLLIIHECGMTVAIIHPGV